MQAADGHFEPSWLRSARTAIGTVPWLILVACAALCPFAIAWGHQNSLTGVALLFVALVALYLIIPRALQRPLSQLSVWRAPYALLACILIGSILRIAWVGLVPPVQLSDYQQYLESARALLAGDGYYVAAAGQKFIAYRAPGQSFLLAGVFAVFGDHLWTIALLNVALYIAAALLLYYTVVLISTRARAIAANAMLAVWPSNVMMTGLAFSEAVSLVLWSAALLCLLRSDLLAARWPAWLVAGAALGAGILVRPSKLMAPLFISVLALTATVRRRAVLAALAVTAAAALVVAPWSYRNYQALGHFVSVSTNGGDNFYRANNPLATGGFVETGEYDFRHLLPDEVAWNEASMRAGLDWIAGNPLGFVTLGLKKLMITLGSDNTGAYWSLNRAHGIESNLYDIAVLLSDAWWLVLWSFVAAALWRQREFLITSTAGQLLTSFSGYFFVIHAVYESQPRYHMPAVGALLAIAVLVSSSSASKHR